MRMSPSKKATVESRQVGLTGTKYQKSACENYTHSSRHLVTFALCHTSGACNFVSNTRSRTRCVWFNGSRVPRKGKVACKNIFPAFKWYLEPEKNIRGMSNTEDYTGEIYLAI